MSPRLASYWPHGIAVDVIGPYPVSFDDPGLYTTDGWNDLNPAGVKVADLQKDTVVLFAWAVVREDFESVDVANMFVSVGPADLPETPHNIVVANVTLIPPEADVTDVSDIYVRGINSPSSPVYASFSVATAVCADAAALYAQVATSEGGGGLSAGEADVYALVVPG